jgi:imidazolonepropionase-like amidohydrolase
MQESGECLKFDPLNAPGLSLQAAVIKAAHRHGLLTVAHATNLRETMLVLEAGVDGLAHQFFDKPHTDELIDAYKKHGAFVVPTLVAVNSMIGLGSSNEFAQDPRAILKLKESSKACLCNHMSIALPYCDVQYAYDCVKALKSAGIDIVWLVSSLLLRIRMTSLAPSCVSRPLTINSGTDSAAGIQGTALGASVHHELSLYVQHCKFSPIEALQSSTSVAARRFGLSDRGIIAEGKKADIVLVRGNPTVDISDTLNIERVWKHGVLHHVPSGPEKQTCW